VDGLNRKIRDRLATMIGSCVHVQEMAQTKLFSPIWFFNLQLIEAFVRLHTKNYFICKIFSTLQKI
jgi:hypothetical protein